MVDAVKRIVISASMDFLPQIKAWKSRLEKHGLRVYTPTLINHRRCRHTHSEMMRLKRIDAKKHFSRIEKADAMLVLNYDKNGNQNYIGGSTFAEMAVAYYLGKEIFLLNPVPQDLPYTEELKAWRLRRWTMQPTGRRNGEDG